VIHLEQWGWDEDHQVQFRALCQSIRAQGQVPARILEEQRDGYRVLTQDGERRAIAAGRLHHESRDPDALPAVGDWVTAHLPADGGPCVVHAVLPRRTALLRKQAGRTATAQVVAANVDVVLLVTSLNADLEPRRVERYLAAIWESGADPVLLLNKADLCEDPAAVTADLDSVALGVPVHVLSAARGEGLAALDPYLRPARTLAVVGSSGVGKSTLINALAGDDLQVVRGIREADDRGRHTTTARRLLRLPDGALLVDTPGMREFALWDAEEGLDGAFEDVTALEDACRFRDCGHASEPGCAIRAAVDAGDLDAERVEAWRKLGREMAFLRAKQSRRAALEQRRGFRRQGKIHRQAAQMRKRMRDGM